MEYKVLSTLKHDGDLYKPGETVELSERRFNKLPAGTVEPLTGTKEKGEKPRPKK